VTVSLCTWCHIPLQLAPDLSKTKVPFTLTSLSSLVRMLGCLLNENAAHNFSVTVRPPAQVQHKDIIPTPSRLTDYLTKI